MKLTIKKGLVLLLVFALGILMFLPQNAVRADAAAKTTVTSLRVKDGNKTVTRKTISMKAGKKKTLTVTAKPKAAAKTAAYKSSKPSVVSVNKNGRLTAKKAGTARITITVSSQKYKKNTTWVKVKVTAAEQEKTGSQNTNPSSKGTDVNNDTQNQGAAQTDTDVNKDIPDSGNTDVNANTGNSENSQQKTDTPAPPSGTKKSLVVYYSASGNTRRVAQEIASAANADIFEITPSETYTSADLNWTDSNSRVNREHENASLQNQVALTSVTVPDWSNYDTVFIGYPIWWGIAAWPVNGFVTANDFTGKTIIPFCTSSSSPIGASGTNLAAMAGTGNWQEGHRFSGRASQSDVNTWVQSLNLN